MSSETSDSNDHSSKTSKPTNSANISGTEISDEGSNDHISETSKPLDSADIRGTEVGTDAAVFLGNSSLDNTASDAQPLAKIGAIAEKTKPGVCFITNKDGEEEAIGDDDPRLDGLSKYDFQDDPISAASGATYNLGSTPIAMSELYLGEVVHPAKALFFMWAIVFTGYSCAALARQFLIYDPQYPW
jgi:hypothetical protein